MTVCKHVFYSGRVQGVGFRYTAQNVAEDYEVAGFVRNLPDGMVEVLAEGSPQQVDAFLTALAQRMAGYIDQTRVVEEGPIGAKDFRVRY
jgi:acylphosphatase